MLEAENSNTQFLNVQIHLRFIVNKLINKKKKCRSRIIQELNHGVYKDSHRQSHSEKKEILYSFYHIIL